MTAREAIDQSQKFESVTENDGWARCYWLRALVLLLDERLPVPPQKAGWVSLEDVPVHETNERILGKIAALKQFDRFEEDSDLQSLFDELPKETK